MTKKKEKKKESASNDLQIIIKAKIIKDHLSTITTRNSSVHAGKLRGALSGWPLHGAKYWDANSHFKGIELRFGPRTEAIGECVDPQSRRQNVDRRVQVFLLPLSNI